MVDWMKNELLLYVVRLLICLYWFRFVKRVVCGQYDGLQIATGFLVISVFTYALYVGLKMVERRTPYHCCHCGKKTDVVEKVERIDSEYELVRWVCAKCEKRFENVCFPTETSRRDDAQL